MAQKHQGAFRLFRLFGIEVYLHWVWFLVAAYQIFDSSRRYSSINWNILEYLSLFVIVLLHEFGHSLACRSVGGRANLILLWPFGGIAYVSPPQRAGAMLWSIAAGPLVNVALVPVTFGLATFGHSLGWKFSHPDLQNFLQMMMLINLFLLIFNLLPVYPLDGGQILRSLLWFAFGRAKSLMIASVVGFVGVAAVLAYAVWAQSNWLIIMTLLFIAPRCWQGFQQARELSRREKMPRHADYKCPSCHESPVAGEFWQCGKCGAAFDTFVTRAVCPNCQTQFAQTACLDCGEVNAFTEWTKPDVSPPKL